MILANQLREYKAMRILSVLIMGLILLNCSGEEEKVKKMSAPDVTYTELQRITGDTLFIGVNDIEVRDNGNIIVSESMRGFVTELSPNGSFVRRIGRQGNGPGEFRRPYMIEMIQDSLFLFDNLNSRMTVYGPTGEYLKSVSKDHFFSNDFYAIENGFLNINFDPILKNNTSLFSFFDDDFNQINIPKITLKDLLGSYYKPIHSYMLFSDPIHSARTSNNTFLLTSQLYTGKIYEYTLSLPEGLFLSDSLTGLPVDNLYYESDKFIDNKPYDPETKKGVNVRLKSLSLGLFVLEGGRVVHFVMKDDENVREVGVELFSAGKDFLGYKPIKTDSTLYDEDRMKWSFIKAYDGHNTFYTNATDENGEAQVVVFRLQIDED